MLAQIALALFYADWSLFVVPPPVILVLLFLLICGNEKNLVEVDESAEMRDTTGNEICPDATTGATE